ncbi:potassium-transporting ATPase subunit KdpA [Ktedonospora formicarum]|uniref:potassium-transporting ATPase subunit KdpA n=1 Tax=Ktedonospora formicarum TaxID=2778364 RepID=UPI001C68B7CA|nr:potassium-transporting ATPase subunit KdpA [Ktedonospora formicarum]
MIRLSCFRNNRQAVSGSTGLLHAGKLSRQSRRPMTPGKLQTDSVLLGIVIIFTMLIVVGLASVAVLALGPIVEPFRMG